MTSNSSAQVGTAPWKRDALFMWRRLLSALFRSEEVERTARDNSTPPNVSIEALNLRKRVLFVASGYSYFREMAPVVWHFAEEGWYVQVLLGTSGTIADDVVDQCRARAIPVDITPSGIGYGHVGSAEPSQSGRHPVEPNRNSQSAWQKIRRVLRSTRLGRFRMIPGQLIRMRRVRRYADKLISHVKPDVVFQGPFYSVGQIDNAIARACVRRKIPRYCVPMTGYVGRRHLIVARSVHIKTGQMRADIVIDYDWVNRLFSFLVPSWTCRLSNGQQAFYWDPVFISLAWISRLSLDRHWMRPAVDFNRVFVFSEYSFNLLKVDGYPMERVIVSGQPLLDTVWERGRDEHAVQELFAYLRLEDFAPFLLVNIEPSVEHLYCNWDRHWRNFQDLMNAVIGHGLPVVLSLHPLCDAAHYDFAEEKYGVFICKDFKIHDLYPFCTLSISFPCSTNLLATTFDKPLVIYDFFNVATADPDSAYLYALPGAPIASEPSVLGDIIRTALKNVVNSGSTVPLKMKACDTIFNVVASDLTVRPPS